MIPYTSTFIRLSHLYYKFYVHFILVMNDGGMARLGVVDSCQGVGGATGGGY